MVWKLARGVLVGAVLAALGSLAASQASAQDCDNCGKHGHRHGHGRGGRWASRHGSGFADATTTYNSKLFQNYYVGPSDMGGEIAGLYLSPRPTPPLVGHTYITYEPLMPHEFLYHHHRTYRAYQSDGHGTTRTRVWWH